MCTFLALPLLVGRRCVELSSVRPKERLVFVNDSFRDTLNRPTKLPYRNTAPTANKTLGIRRTVEMRPGAYHSAGALSLGRTAPPPLEILFADVLTASYTRHKSRDEVIVCKFVVNFRLFRLEPTALNHERRLK